MAKREVTTVTAPADTLSKAERVRSYMDEHPQASPKDVADALSKFGISAQYVSLIKMKHKSRKKAERIAIAPDAQLTYSALMTAATLIKECGGPEQAKMAVNAVAEFMNLSAGIKAGV